jgi:autotransporter translocation and assembly factor TamB
MKTKSKLPGRLLKTAVVCFFILTVLAVACLFFITLPPGENLIKAYLEEKLTTALHTEVRIGHLETNLFSNLLLTNITIRNAEPSPADTIAEVRRL